MTTQNATPWLEPFKYARNGQYPDAVLQSEMCGLANHLALYRMKEIARFGMTMTGVRASPASAVAEPRWRCQYTASPYATRVVVFAYMAQATLENPANAPYALFEFDDQVSLVHTAEIYYGAAASENANPDYNAGAWTRVRDATDPTTFFEPVAGTTYNVTVSDVQSRIIACSMYEISEGADGPFSEGQGAGTMILDADRSSLLAYARLAWKTQAAPLFAWTVDVQAVPRTRTSATPINLIDNATTTVGGASVGFTVDVRSRDRISTALVPCVFRVYAKVSADEATVALKDSGGTEVATATITGTTAAWYEVGVDLPATRAKYDMHFYGNGVDTLSVYACQLVQHETGT